MNMPAGAYAILKGVKELRELLLKLVSNKKAVFDFINRLSPAEIERGRLTITPQMLSDLLSALGDDSWRIDQIRFSDQGEIFFQLETKGMTLSYRLKPERLGMEQGKLFGSITYHEERSGGGLSGALLGMTGKSGLAFALSKYRGIEVNNRQLRLHIDDLPKSLEFALAGVSARGLSLRLY
jgi:hypothetical protein